MTRTSGSKNIKPFGKLKKIESFDNKIIKHLGKAKSKSALEQFEGILKNQRNYIKWIESRHHMLITLKKQLKYRSPKDKTYREYKWYAEQNSLLEAINAFEVFYKRSLINLAKSLRNYVPTERLKGTVDSRILWSVSGRFSTAELIFEHQLSHSFDSIDAVTHMIIQDKRYNKLNPKSSIASTNINIQSIFQIRHTLSHNYGLIIRSDQENFKMLGFDARYEEVIDPDKNNFGKPIYRFLGNKAKNFTEWLINATAHYLDGMSKNTGVSLDRRVLTRIQKEL